MTIIDSRTWLEYLDAHQCWELLAAQGVGRIGVIADSAPEIYPVNYVVDGDSLLFRTDPGNKLRGLGRSPSVCFEIDEIDVDAHTGWSVLIKGRAEELHAPAELRRAAQLPLTLWTIGDKHYWIRIRPTEITGRRIRPLQENAG